MTRILTSHLVSLPDRQSSKKIVTHVPGNNQQTVPRNNQTVPRNNNVMNRNDARARAPLDNIPSASWFNSNLPPSSIPHPRSSVCNPVPRTNVQNNKETIQVRDAVVSSALPPKRKRDRQHRRERRAKERERKSEAFIHDARWASQRPGDPSSSSIPAQVTQVRPTGQRPHIIHEDGNVPASRIRRQLINQ